MHLRSKTVQQLLSVILSAVMVLSMLPMEVLAQETPPVTTPMDLTAITEDTSGDGWSWTQSTKTLTLTGLTLTVSDDSAHALILPDGATIDLADGTASTLTGGSNSGSITCTNTLKNDRWLNGFSDVIANIFGIRH